MNICGAKDGHIFFRPPIQAHSVCIEALLVPSSAATLFNRLLEQDGV